jgi:hypothetical protein
MQPIILILAFAFVALFAATPALAQRRVPDAGMLGAGASVGATVPTDFSVDSGLAVGGTIEGYLTPRPSVRGQLYTAWWDFQPLQGLVGSVRPTFVVGHLVYNWERGAVHPYVTVGGGMYRYAIERVVSSRSTVNATDTHGGLNLGGGFEYFLRRRETMTVELLYHRVGELASPLAFTNGTFWSFAIGLKAYVGR